MFFLSSGIVRESVAKQVEEQPSTGGSKMAATVRLLVKLIFLALILVGLLFGYQVSLFLFFNKFLEKYLLPTTNRSKSALVIMCDVEIRSILLILILMCHCHHC